MSKLPSESSEKIAAYDEFDKNDTDVLFDELPTCRR